MMGGRKVKNINFIAALSIYDDPTTELSIKCNELALM